MADVTRTVGRFEILREIGRGGMAVVYLARQNDLDRLVALKELPAFHAADSDFAERFLRESRIAGSLSHPNIVTVHDYFDVEATPYISMEYLERGSLRPHMRNMSLPQVAGVLEGLLAALDHAHARGIVHRDLKPENLLLTRQGSVKVADFGIAKAIGQASAVHMLTATGTTVGTPTYMAPEQAMAREIVPATDLYSVGVMGYEMLVGKVPFANAQTPLAVLLQHVNEPPPPPLSIRPDLDPGLARWVESLLEKDPRNRPPSAEVAWDTFEELVLSLSGPRWRREARLLEPGEAGAAPKPLTPAPFPLPVETGEGAEASGFLDVRRRGGPVGPAGAGASSARHPSASRDARPRVAYAGGRGAAGRGLARARAALGRRIPDVRCGAGGRPGAGAARERGSRRASGGSRSRSRRLGGRRRRPARARGARRRRVQDVRRGSRSRAAAASPATAASCAGA